MIKKLAAVLLMLLLLMTGALAEGTLHNRKLTNKSLLKAIKGTEYASWTLYQPNDRERDLDLTKVKAFKKYPYFPVLAVNGDDMAILLLRRSGKSWTFASANRTALTRPGCTLTNFSMDERMGTEENERMFIGFSFQLDEGGWMELFLEPGEISRRFSFISYIPASRTAENLFADGVEIMFNSGLRYSYRNQATQNTWSYSLDTQLPLAAEYANFDVFDLAQVPLTIAEALVPGTIARDTLLRQFPGESAALGEVHAGDEVRVPFDAWGYQHMDWVPVMAQGAMGYVPRACIAGAAE